MQRTGPANPTRMEPEDLSSLRGPPTRPSELCVAAIQNHRRYGNTYIRATQNKGQHGLALGRNPERTSGPLTVEGWLRPTPSAEPSSAGVHTTPQRHQRRHRATPAQRATCTHGVMPKELSQNWALTEGLWPRSTPGRAARRAPGRLTPSGPAPPPHGARHTVGCFL